MWKLGNKEWRRLCSKQTDRQTDRLPRNRQADGSTERQMDRWTGERKTDPEKSTDQEKKRNT